MEDQLISKKKLLVNSGSSLATKAIRMSVLVWLQQHLLRHISTDEYSILPVTVSILAFMPILTSILTSGLGRFVMEAYAKKDNDRICGIVSTMFPILLLAAICLVGLGGLFSWRIDFFLNIPPSRLFDARVIMFLFLLSMAISLPMTPFSLGLYVRQDFVRLNIINLAAELFRVALLFSLLFGISTRVLWVVVASVVSGALGLSVRLLYSMKAVPALRFRVSRIQLSLARPLISFGSWNFIGEVAYAINTNADPIILNKLATPLQVTLFNLGSLPRRHLFDAWLMAFGPLRPVLTAMHATDDRARLRNSFVRGSKYGLWASMFFAVPLMVFNKEALDLYVGAEYAGAGTVMLILLAMFPFLMPATMTPNIAAATGKIKQTSIRFGVLQTINLGLTVYLVGRLNMGAKGSALASLIVAAVGYPALIWPVGLRLTNLDPLRFIKDVLWMGLLPATICVAVLLACSRLFLPHSWTGLGLCAGFGWLVYIIIVWFFCMKPFEKSETRALCTLARNRIRSALAGRRSS